MNLLIKSYSYLKTESSLNGLRSYDLYEHENNNLIKYFTHSLNDELRGYREFKYDNNGNVTESAYYDENDNLLYFESYEYDSQPNPLNIDFSFISAFTLSKNNITKWINTCYTTTPPNINISTSTYTYNSFGYPDKCTTIYSRNENGISTQDTSINYYEYYRLK